MQPQVNKINPTIHVFVANDYFQFKEFTVQQEHCAMKVCTDACLLGAYTTWRIHNRQLAADTILDIGTGTGLLSLMAAQKTTGEIDAIEIDEAAFQQARGNFERSPWKNRLHIFNGNALDFYPGKKYDFIISNPPFFEGDLRPDNKKKKEAKHDTTLTLHQLVTVISRHLSPAGSFAVLLPWHRGSYFIETAISAGYFLNEQLLVRHTRAHPLFRSILFFSHTETEAITSELAIKNTAGDYTTGFVQLLEAYYLYL